MVSVSAELDHALLAGVLGALESEYTEGGHAVLDEELCLELGLWEALNHDIWADLISEASDERHDDSLIVLSLKFVVADEVLKGEELLVGALAQSLADRRLARGLGSNQEGNLGQHCLAGCLVHCQLVELSVNLSDFAKLAVEIHDRHGLAPKVLEPLDQDLFLVVSSA